MLASGKIHKKVGEAFLQKFPVKGMPYDLADTDALLSTLGIIERKPVGVVVSEHTSMERRILAGLSCTDH